MNAEPKKKSVFFVVTSLGWGAAAVGVSAAVSACVAVEGVHVLLCVVVLGLHGRGREHHLLLATS